MTIENKYSDYDCFKREEDLNRKHKLTLTESQISTILYTMEGYMQGTDDNEDSHFVNEVDSIFKVLETTVDKFYDKLAKLKASKPKPEWDQDSTISGTQLVANVQKSTILSIYKQT